ncbi:Hypothetical protein MVR_LOCUS261 [uncultured virus]|nr:Hypothetical protein MVR_LOCUS261 [uncultured virus]
MSAIAKYNTGKINDIVNVQELQGTDSQGNTIFHYIAKDFNINALETLKRKFPAIANSAIINKPNNDGVYPIQIARVIEERNPEYDTGFVDILITKYNADKSKLFQDNSGNFDDQISKMTRGQAIPSSNVGAPSTLPSQFGSQAPSQAIPKANTGNVGIGSNSTTTNNKVLVLGDNQSDLINDIFKHISLYNTKASQTHLAGGCGEIRPFLGGKRAKTYTANDDDNDFDDDAEDDFFSDEELDINYRNKRDRDQEEADYYNEVFDYRLSRNDNKTNRKIYYDLIQTIADSEGIDLERAKLFRDTIKRYLEKYYELYGSDNDAAKMKKLQQLVNDKKTLKKLINEISIDIATKNSELVQERQRTKNKDIDIDANKPFKDPAKIAKIMDDFFKNNPSDDDDAAVGNGNAGNGNKPKRNTQPPSNPNSSQGNIKLPKRKTNVAKSSYLDSERF